MFDDVRHSNNERLFDRYLAATLILVLDWFQILFQENFRALRYALL